MNQEYGATAAHHPSRCNWRRDPGREQTGDPAAGSRRQTARSSFLPEEIEGVVRQHLDMNRQRRVTEVYAPMFRLFDQSADFPLDLWRRERKPLVGTPDAHAEGVHV